MRDVMTYMNLSRNLRKTLNKTVIRPIMTYEDDAKNGRGGNRYMYMGYTYDGVKVEIDWRRIGGAQT